MPWLGIRHAEYEPGATRYAARRYGIANRLHAMRKGTTKGKWGVPTQAFPQVLKNLSAA